MVCTPPSVGGSTAAGARVLLQAAAAAAAAGGVRLSDGEREWRQAAQGGRGDYFGPAAGEETMEEEEQASDCSLLRSARGKEING